MKNIFIGDREVGKRQSCFLIAEIGQAHEGSLGIAHSYIDAVDTDLDKNRIKLQMNELMTEAQALEIA